MPCYHPIEVINKRTKEVRLVPCGKCVGCKQDYQNQWKLRLNETLKEFDYCGVFFTLTYAPETAPDTGLVDDYCKFTPFDISHDRHRVLSVCVADVQKWLKRGRRRMEYFYGKSKPFKYFITSEYGPTTLRPHYHGIITLKKSDFEKFFLPDWTSLYIKKYYKDKTSKFVKNTHYKGNVVYEEILFDGSKSPMACCDYISKYCSKGCFENPRVDEGSVNKCFHLASKGIGITLLDQLKDDLIGDYVDCSHVIEEVDEISARSFNNKCRTYEKDVYFGLLENFNPKYHDKFPSYFESGIFHDKDDKGNIVRSYYKNIVALLPRLDFLEELCSRLYVRYPATKAEIAKYNLKEGYFTYKLPRYYYDKLFPKNSALRKGVQITLQLLSDERLSRKLATLRSEWPDETDTQIYHRYLVQEASQNAQAESRAYRRSLRFYNKSIL